MKSRINAVLAIPVFVMLLMLSRSLAAAPALNVTATVTTYPDIEVTVSLSNTTPLEPYGPLAGIQLSLTYPSSILFVGITKGAAASQHNLQFNFIRSLIAPTGPDVVHVLLTPTATDNSSTFVEGTLLTFTLRRIAGTATSTFSLVNTVIGNPTANSQNHTSTSSTITWGADTDGDGTPDNWDSDDDNDGMPDWYETKYGLNPLVANGTVDSDGDGLTNLQEFQYGTNPLAIDTDGDGVNDKTEVDQGRNPNIDDALIPAIMTIINSLLLE